MYHVFVLQMSEMTNAQFNRRMRKTACPVVWKGHGVQLPVTPSDQADRLSFPLPIRVCSRLVDVGRTSASGGIRARHRGRPYKRTVLATEKCGYGISKNALGSDLVKKRSIC